MKANAPEKIFIQSFNNNEEDAIYFDAVWTEEHEPGQENIEYTSTDAFIEKACEYLNKSCRRFILTEKDIEDFKNYMKGEQL